MEEREVKEDCFVRTKTQWHKTEQLPSRQFKSYFTNHYRKYSLCGTRLYYQFMIRQSDVGKEKEAGCTESMRVKWQLDVSWERKHAPGGRPVQGTASENKHERGRKGYRLSFMPTSQAGCGPAGSATNRKSLLILVFPNDAEEFSSFPLSFLSVCVFLLLGPTLPLESFRSDHTPPVPVAPIGSVWKSCNPRLTATGDSPGTWRCIWGMFCLFSLPFVGGRCSAGLALPPLAAPPKITC